MKKKVTGWDKVLEEVKAMEESNKPYYRIYFHKENNQVCFPCMQPFDENDYHQDRFILEQRFNTEEEARDAFILLRAKAQWIATLNYEV